MIITHHREKLINAIVYFAQNTKACGKVKLMKLLFFLDFNHFKETGRAVTGLDYFAWKMGPVPVELFNEMSDKMGSDLSDAIAVVPIELEKGTLQLIKAKPKRKFDGKHFTQREMKLLEMTAEIFRDADAEQMTMVSHLPNEPWHKTLREKGEKAKIEYMLAISDTSSYDEIMEKNQEVEQMHNLFGTVEG